MPALLSSGCSMVIVEPDDEAIALSYPNAQVLVVPSVLEALQTIARWHRQQFQLPVVAITGSNGKTIIKEWLGQLLSPHYRVVKSPKSYNSQIGVPLSVWQLREEHTIGVFEAGISQPGEMAALESIIAPSIGVFTNLGAAHDQGFSSRQQKLEEKWLLMKNCTTVIYPSHYQLIDDYAKSNAQEGQTLVSWHYELLRAGSLGKPSRIRVFGHGGPADFVIPFNDGASIENCCHAIVLMQVLGLKGTLIQEGLRGLKPVSMRLELKEGVNDCYIIDDCYSNDLIGLAQALDFLDQQQAKLATRTKTLILSDLLETGLQEQELYASVANLLNDKHLDKLILIGNAITNHHDLFSVPSIVFPDTASFLKSPVADSFNTELVLVKGARRFQFEQIVQHLQAKAHGTRLEINLDAVAHNFKVYKGLLETNTKVMVMVKAFAYGSGSQEIASLLQYHGADYLAVAYADEGVALRKGGITVPIMVMNPGAESFEKLLQHDLEAVLYSPELLAQYVRYLRTIGHSRHLPASIHIEVETGMNRLGFGVNQLPALVRELVANSKLIKVKGVFSHLSAADEPIMEDFSRQQISQFRDMANKLEQQLGYSIFKHLLNSPGITRFPDAQFDMVRLGIGLYGYDPNGVVQHLLQPVGRLKATISQIKEVKAGDTVGYSRKGVASKDTRIATLSIGYADGFDRRLSNGVGVVKVNGKRVPVIGNVCMDMTMVDLGSIPAKEGDDAIIFDDDLTIQQMAATLNTIPYEILTKVSERVKRVFYTEQV